MFSHPPSLQGRLPLAPMIATAAIYVFMILIFFVSPKIFWATLAVILLVYFFGGATAQSAQAEQIFSVLVWVALILVIIIIILALVAYNSASDKIDSMLKRFGGAYFMIM